MPNTRPINQPVPTQSEREKHTQWHTLHCELVTPMYGGGVESTKVDKNMPIRVTAIRGQLRFWWRLLAKQKWGLQGDALRNAEFALWGGMSDGDTDGQASKVWLRVIIPNKKREKEDENNEATVEQWAGYEMNHRGREVLTPKVWSNVPYALFPAQGRTQENPNEEPHKLLREGLQWQLHIAFSPTIKTTTPENSKPPSEKEQVWEAIRWWTNFGGIGARTRRGLGAFSMQENDYFEKCITVEEVKSIGLDIKLKSANNPIQGWINAVNKLSSFRQIGIGRNNFSSRSRWPEPDAIRHLKKQSLPRHKERLTQGNIFPRAAFGLPIIFKFKDEGNSKNHEPMPSTLKAKFQLKSGEWENTERLASALILRPYIDATGQWHSMALCLPEELGINPNIRLMLDEEEVTYWDESMATDIKPLQQNSKTMKPLQAFLTYFAK